MLRAKLKLIFFLLPWKYLYKQWGSEKISNNNNNNNFGQNQTKTKSTKTLMHFSIKKVWPLPLLFF